MTEGQDITPRVVSIDVLRGVALLGILIVNIHRFAAPSIAYFNPTVYGDLRGANWYVHALTVILADQKFMAIFSMLFGASIVLFCEKLVQRDLNPTKYFYRRVAWLLVFGLIHTIFVWSGDVLVVYAICGAVIYPCRHWKSSTQCLFGLCVFFSPILLNTAAHSAMPHVDTAQRAILESIWNPDEARLAQNLGVFRDGYRAQVARRLSWATTTLSSQQVPAKESRVQPGSWLVSWTTPLLGSVARAAGMMLLGMAFYRWGMLDATWTRTAYQWMAIVGMCGGIPLSAYEYSQRNANQWDADYCLFVGSNMHLLSTLLIAMGYTACIMQVCQRGSLVSGRGRWLAGIGRMSLTNYIAQSVMATYVFYGFGLGYYGYLSRVQQLAVVIAIWAIQLAVSWGWLRRVDQGPLEWVWRRLTFGGTTL